MAAGRGLPRTVLAWVLIGAGALYFASTLGTLGPGTSRAAVLAVAGVVLVVLVLRADPAWLLTGAIVSTMFAGNWDQLRLSTTLGPDRVLLGAGILAVLLRAPPARARPRIALGRTHFVMGSALAYVVISSIFAGTLGRHYSQVELLDQFGALPFVMFVVAPATFATERQRQILLGCLVATGAYLSVTAVFEKLGVSALVFPGYISNAAVGDHSGRARGPFVEAGAEGLALYTCGIAAAIGVITWRERRLRLCAGAVVVLSALGMLLTVTRVVWIAGIAATLVILVSTPQLRRFLIPFAAVGVAVVLAGLTFIPGLAAQVQQRQADQGPIWERQNNDAAGLRMVAARPLLGFGWDKWRDNIVRYYRLGRTYPLVGQQAGLHNIYLQYGVDLGLVGMALWLGALGLAFVPAVTRLAPPRFRPWQIGLKGVLVAWLIVGLTSPSSYLFSTILLWTWGGIVYGATMRARPAKLAQG